MNRPIIAMLTLLLSFSVLSCEEGSNTIFDNIVNDNLIDDSELDNKLSVYSMVRFDANGQYYIAAGKIHHRAVDSDSWGSFRLDQGIHNTIATDQTFLYVGVLYDNGSGSLFCYDPTQLPASRQAVDLGTNARRVLKVKNFGTAVYAAVQYEDGTSSLLTISGTTSAPVGAWATGLADVISDFSVATSVIITAGSHVYCNSTAEAAPDDPGFTFTGVGEFEGYVYLSSNDGALYRTANTTPSAAADWTERKTFSVLKNSTRYPVRFTEFNGITGSPGHLFVGARGAGFYEIEPDDFTVTRFPQTSKADLYNGAVESFFIDNTPDPPIVFCCTMGAGLWSNTYTLGTGWGDQWHR